MGGSLELEGGRRTRSSTRGTPTRAGDTVTPPPSKKARTSPASATKASGGAGKGRGARKLDVGGEEPEPEPEKVQTPAKGKVNNSSTIASNDVKLMNKQPFRPLPRRTRKR